ncbi:hypothetical protein M768_13805 [Cellulosimicrobium cellulans F16]|uniref:Uncharacterized protein n=1 Tax=Cellulosimicrobium cellulans F16 TaxID=1350482 RepID=A0A0M0F510_CELCE|nr:hypothetical protein [Cellulosimicrobium cellulans]KON72578.1 hypothetical protein M768_13805 [Cellulosimicrobium cellulans F16]
MGRRRARRAHGRDLVPAAERRERHRPGHLWSEPYDEQIAVDALDRANRLHANLAALESISTAARDAWITQQPRATGCWDCSRYPDGHGLTKPGHRPPADTLAGLIP